MIAVRRAGLVLGVLCIAAAASDISLAEPLQQNGEEWLKVRANGYVRAKKTVAQIQKSLMHFYKRTDIDGGGISYSDHRLKEQKESIRQRSRHLTNWLNRDLDGNGVVTREELERLFIGKVRKQISIHGIRLQPTPEQISQSLSNLVGKALKADADGDGNISFSEILSHAKTKQRPSRRPWWGSYLVPLSLDRDGDEMVTEEEYAKSIGEVLRKIDVDGNGRFSAGEVAALRKEVKQLRKIARSANRAPRRRKKATGTRRKQKIRGARRKQRVAGAASTCQFPAVPAGAKVILLGTHEGYALSTTSLGNGDDVVSVANLWIEPGNRPLYIIVSSGSPMIWQVSGYLDRVTALVANAYTPNRKNASAAGVVGLPKDRVYVTPNSDCIDSFTQSQSSRADGASAKLRNILGRSADSILANQSVNTVSLPSGIFDNMAAYGDAVHVRMSGPGGPLWRQLFKRRPGGLVRVTPYSVVSRLQAKPYEVLPRQAGLARLLEDGALEIIGSHELVTDDGTPIRGAEEHGINVSNENGELSDFSTHREFRILKKFSYPPGLSNGHAVWFLLAPGVERPDGNPGQSCLIDQKTGKTIVVGRHCRNDPV